MLLVNYHHISDFHHDSNSKQCEFVNVGVLKAWKIKLAKGDVLGKMSNGGDYSFSTPF
jgi:hypothetical protein